jgi:hypothetical protein
MYSRILAYMALPQPSSVAASPGGGRLAEKPPRLQGIEGKIKPYSILKPRGFPCE